MVDLVESVRGEIEKHRLLEPGRPVVVGVSGGPDSLCLLHVLKQLQPIFAWSLYVAHLNHCLRGEEADQDMVFVALQATKWGLPCMIEAVDVDAVAQEQGRSVEETGRRLRYRFLARVARRVGAGAVAVGHHADDQSETVLMHLLRGTGLAGLRGMPPAVNLSNLQLGEDRAAETNVKLVRPLLTVSRAAIEAYCQAHHLPVRFDRSNLDTAFFRNRLRHELLPMLETYNPNIRAQLRRTAAVASADYELLSELRDESWEQLVKNETAAFISFDRSGWKNLPLALQRALVRKASYRLAPELRDVNFVHIEQAVRVAQKGSTGDQVTLPQGLSLTVDYDTIRFSRGGETPPPPDRPLLWSATPLPVAVPGRTLLPGSGWELETCLWAGNRDQVWNNADRWTAYLDLDRLGSNPVLRPRKPRDRFQPLGMAKETVKVADLFINNKVPQRWREHIPLLVHAVADKADSGSSGELEQQAIAWVVGFHIDECVKVTAETRRILRLRWRRNQIK